MQNWEWILAYVYDHKVNSYVRLTKGCGLGGVGMDSHFGLGVDLKPVE